MSWSPTLQTIYVGCQDTSLQWFDFSNPTAPLIPSLPPSPSTPLEPPFSSASPCPTAISRKVHKFFDSYPLYERKPADLFANNNSGTNTSDPDANFYIPQQGYLSIPATNVIDSAHYGYIYCIAIQEHADSVQLATGSGDETVKVRPKGKGTSGHL